MSYCEGEKSKKYFFTFFALITVLFFLSLSAVSQAWLPFAAAWQNRYLKLFAGQENSPGNTDGMGAAARFSAPRGLALDSSGNLYVADTGNNAIRKLTQDGVVSTVQIGNLGGPQAITVKSNGELYIGDTQNNKIMKYGNGVALIFADSADGVSGPRGLAFDANGNLYVGNMGSHNILKIDPTGSVTVFAGSAGNSGYSDGTGINTKFSSPRGLVVDSSGNLFVADTGNHAIRKITSGGQVTTFAGAATGGATAASFADGVGSVARFNEPRALAIDSVNNIYVADKLNNAIRKITPDGRVSTIIGRPTLAGQNTYERLPARLNSPYGIAVNSTSLFISSYDTTRGTLSPGHVILKCPKP